MGKGEKAYNNIRAEKKKRGGGAMADGVIRHACFTREQQDAYSMLTEKQRRYVDYRGRGFGKTEAYHKAGFTGANLGTAAYLLESRNANVKELIEVLQSSQVPKGLEYGSEADKKLQEVAERGDNRAIQAIIENADSENAKRIQFYRDVMAGRIRSVKRTVRRNGRGEVIETKIEESSDVDIKMKARKELDKILMLNDLPDMSNMQVGDITIHIVDATKKDEVDRPNEVLIEGNEIFEEVQEGDIQGDNGKCEVAENGSDGGKE